MLQLSWRNVWRNKRRTLITAFAIAFAMLFSIAMRSMQLGSYEQMLSNITDKSVGHIQIHKNGFWKEKILDNAMPTDATLLDKLRKEADITGIYPRIETGALCVVGNKTRVIGIMGMDIEAEKSFSNPQQFIKKGTVPAAGSGRIIIGERLSEILNVDVNDTVAFIGQGFQGSSANGLFVVGAIAKFGIPQMNNSMAIMPMEDVQHFTGAYGHATALILTTQSKEPADLTVFQASLQANWDTTQYEVMTWMDMSREVLQQIEIDKVSGEMFIAIIYLIVGFVIFGTILMLVTERTKELRTLRSIGMTKLLVGKTLATEIFMTTLLGAFLGLILSGAIVLYFVYNPIPLTGDMAEVYLELGFEPILFFYSKPDLFISQILLVCLMTLLTAILPLRKAIKIKPV